MPSPYSSHKDLRCVRETRLRESGVLVIVESEKAHLFIFLLLELHQQQQRICLLLVASDAACASVNERASERTSPSPDGRSSSAPRASLDLPSRSGR
jgi:hypothetical protein